MAKRTPPSQADDTMTSSATPTESRARAPRSRGSRSGGEARGGDTPQFADTEAARPAETDTAPPEDTIASDPDATRLEPIENRNAVNERDQPTQEEIRARAYHLYLERGGVDGMHEDDWYRAEQELRTRKR